MARFRCRLERGDSEFQLGLLGLFRKSPNFSLPFFFLIFLLESVGCRTSRMIDRKKGDETQAVFPEDFAFTAKDIQLLGTAGFRGVKGMTVRC